MNNPRPQKLAHASGSHKVPIPYILKFRGLLLYTAALGRTKGGVVPRLVGDDLRLSLSRGNVTLKELLEAPVHF